MRKKLATILTFGMALAMPFTAMAATISESGNQSGMMNLEYTQKTAYTVTIPDDVTFASAEESKAATVKAEGVVIDHGTSLKVAVKSDNYDAGWKLADEKVGGDKIDYTFEANNIAVDNNGILLTVPAGQATGETTLTLKGPKAALKSGTYKDTLTFTVTVD